MALVSTDETAGNHGLLQFFSTFFTAMILSELTQLTTRPWDARRRCFDFVETFTFLARTLQTNSSARWQEWSGGWGTQLCWTQLKNN